MKIEPGEIGPDRIPLGIPGLNGFDGLFLFLQLQ